ncbi:hypothetical protein [Sporosarcina sp. OR05]|uniref:hypothetical protein n=1 Tax=Sporosarcina sp. OR05 TaxID=2969819 RepID=UPI00352B4A42
MDKREARKRRRKKKSRVEVAKFLIGAVLLIGIIGSSVSITFASQDVQSLLTSWFDTQRGNAIEDIKGTIDTEREFQMERLKEELQSEIQSANERLQTFTEDEKTKRTAALRSYTDALIQQFSVDNTEEENYVVHELESIFQNAVSKMEQVMANSASKDGPISESPPEAEGQPVEDPVSEKDPVSEPNPEPSPEPDPSEDAENEISEAKDGDQ